MRICGQEFGLEIIEKIKYIVGKKPSISMRKLSLEICERMNWRSSNGKLKEMSCRKALLELKRRGLVELPVISEKYAYQNHSLKGEKELIRFPNVRCNIKELGEIEIIPITSRYSKASRIWKTMMDKFHYLGSGPLCGFQIRYLIKSSEYGWIGGLSFSSPTWSLKERDEWIGWSDTARIANLHKIVCNSRFLIIPTVEVKCIASYSLSQCIRRLPKDWEVRYGYKPVLLETFVDPEYFKGISYRASNWIQIGKTTGRRDKDSDIKKSCGKKKVYVYPLEEGWQGILCKEPERPLVVRPRPINPYDWVEEEFGRIDFYDNRLRERLFIIARDFYNQPGELIPQACNGLIEKTKGAYRFLTNKKVKMKKLLKPHIESTVERIRKQEIVLVVQDTTTLNYTAHPSTEGLGPINTKKDKGTGLILHDTMSFTLKGAPLGLIDVQCWARDPEEAGKREYRKELPIEEKESIKWLNSYRAAKEIKRLCPDTRFVVIGDRESDIYELFYEATREATNPDLLIRAEKSRKRKVDGKTLWDKMGKEPVKGYQVLTIPRKGSRRERNVRMEVRFAPVMLNPPRGKSLPPIKVWCIYTREVNPPSDVKEPVEWMLLTTIEVSSFKEAVEKIEWYSKRWGIEVYHRTLKSGCRIEDRRLDEARRLEGCLAIDMVIAWRIFYMTKIGRETPDIPCDVFLREEEWQALYAYVKKELPPEKCPSVYEAVRMIASLGGFLGRKGDGEPGTMTMWRGLQRVADITLGFNLHRYLYLSRATSP